MYSSRPRRRWPHCSLQATPDCASLFFLAQRPGAPEARCWALPSRPVLPKPTLKEIQIIIGYNLKFIYLYYQINLSSLYCYQPMGQRLGLAPRKPCGLTHVGGSQGCALPHRVGGRSVVSAPPPGQTRGPDLGVAGGLGVSLPPSCAPRGWRGLAPSPTSLPPPRLSPAPACASMPRADLRTEHGGDLGC